MRANSEAPRAREVVFHALRLNGQHPITLDGEVIGRGLFYSEICKLVEPDVAANTVRFQLGSLFHRGVIKKQMTDGTGLGRRPPTLYWTDPGWAEDDPRRERLAEIIYTPGKPMRGYRRSYYAPGGPRGLQYASGIHYPAWTRLPVGRPLGELQRRQRERQAAFPWAVEDGSEEDNTLDWVDARGIPFAASTHRNPMGPQHPNDVARRLRWYVGRLEQPGYGGRHYDYNKRRNRKRRFRTGK